MFAIVIVIVLNKFTTRRSNDKQTISVGHQVIHELCIKSLLFIIVILIIVIIIISVIIIIIVTVTPSPSPSQPPPLPSSSSSSSSSSPPPPPPPSSSSQVKSSQISFIADDKRKTGRFQLTQSQLRPIITLWCY